MGCVTMHMDVLGVAYSVSLDGRFAWPTVPVRPVQGMTARQVAEARGDLVDCDLPSCEGHCPRWAMAYEMLKRMEDEQ